jgi:hypothetical protein
MSRKGFSMTGIDEATKKPLTLKARLAMADGRATLHPLRKIAPASPYAPIRARALGPRDLPKDT